MENIAEIRNLNKKVSPIFAINDVSFDIKKGYVTGMVGSNGAGKTTIIKMIMGLANKESGNINILGMDMRADESEIKKKIGYVSDTPIFIENKSLKLNKEIIKKFFDEFDEDIFQKYMTQFELKEEKDFCDLSKGMKMKFALAMALSHRPSLLILDEPTAGIDPIFRREMLDVLYDFTSDGEKSVLMSTHITSDLDKIADYLIFVENGKIIMNDEKDKILSGYMIARGRKAEFYEKLKNIAISYVYEMDNFLAIFRTIDTLNVDYTFIKPDIEDIMYLNKKGVR